MRELGLPANLQASAQICTTLKPMLLITLPALFPDVQGDGLIHSCWLISECCCYLPSSPKINKGWPWERYQYTPRKPANSLVMSDAENSRLDIYGHLMATLKHSRRGEEKNRLPSNAIFQPPIHHAMQFLSHKSLSHHCICKNSVLCFKMHHLLAQHSLWSQLGDDILTSWTLSGQGKRATSVLFLPKPEYTGLAIKG